MIWVGAAFVTASSLALRLPASQNIDALYMLLPVSCLGLRYAGTRIVSGFVLGWLITATAIEQEALLRIDQSMMRQDVVLSGEIASLPIERDHISRFIFRVTEGALQGSRLKLARRNMTEKLVPGQFWQLTVRVSEPRGSVNFGLFDYEQWLFAKNIHGRGYVRSAPEPVFLGQDEFDLHALRFRIRESLSEVIPGQQLATYYALSLGDTSQLNPDKWSILNSTGTTHLLIVSGLHVGLIAMLIVSVLRIIGLPNNWVICLTILAAGS